MLYGVNFLCAMTDLRTTLLSYQTIVVSWCAISFFLFFILLLYLVVYVSAEPITSLVVISYFALYYVFV